MADVQNEIELLQIDIQKANAEIAKALRDRRAADKDSPQIPELQAALTAARQSLAAVEVQLRKLYESKGD